MGVLHKINSFLTHFRSFSSLTFYVHPVNMNLTSTTSWQIIPRPEDSVFRLGAMQMACIPNSESSISRSEGYFQNAQLFHMTTKRGLAYFLMPCQSLKPTRSSWAGLLLHFNHI